jgi:hypothetical protein
VKQAMETIELGDNMANVSPDEFVEGLSWL